MFGTNEYMLLLNQYGFISTVQLLIVNLLITALKSYVNELKYSRKQFNVIKSTKNGVIELN